MTEITQKITTEEITNEISLSGTIISQFELDHSIYGEKFYECLLGVNRLSGTRDEIRVVVSERLIQVEDKLVGDRLHIKGQVRTYNTSKGLKICAFVKEVLEESEYDINKLSLIGYICKDPIHRFTPLGREVADIMLAVNRRYYKSDYIPCICWGRTAKYVEKLEVGSKIKVKGRFQSRKYSKSLGEDEIEIRTAWEISIDGLEKVEEVPAEEILD